MELIYAAQLNRRANQLAPRLPLKGVKREAQVDIVCVDEDWKGLRRLPDTEPVADISSDDLAYIIYTSGLRELAQNW